MSKLSKKSEIIEDFNWSEVLGCAPSDCSEQVKKILHRGIHGILWDDITQSMFPIETVSLAKKNLLLDQLKNNVQVPVIQNIRNAKRLSEERKKIASEIDKILAKCQKKEEIIRSKVLKIEKIKSQKKSVEIKKQLLELKYREMKNQMNDCKEMRSVCQELLPASQSGINESTINDCLSRVGAISSRSDKKEAWKYIHENLSGIKITELWDLILQKRIQDSEELFRLGGQEDSIDDNLINKKSNQRLEIGIAKAYGQHISWTLDRYIYLEKMREHRDKGMHCVEKILENDTTNELSDWLLVTIEISQLEAKKTVLLSEIDKLKDSANELSSIGGELRQLECNMHEINDNLENTVQKLQKSLALFEPAIQFISTLKEKLSVALKMILNLHEEHLVEPEWTSINLSIELEVFQEKLVIQALDKIMLGGEIGAYRHVSTCMSNALISHPVLSSASPIMRAPIYQIVDAFQNQTINSALKKRRQYIEATNKFDHNIQSICSGYQRENDIISVLDDTLLVSKKCQQENAKFKSIYDAWINQSVQEAMSIYTDTVHGATFNEWQQRFTNLLYIIQRNK